MRGDKTVSFFEIFFNAKIAQLVEHNLATRVGYVSNLGKVFSKAMLEDMIK